MRVPVIPNTRACSELFFSILLIETSYHYTTYSYEGFPSLIFRKVMIVLLAILAFAHAAMTDVSIVYGSNCAGITCFDANLTSGDWTVSCSFSNIADGTPIAMAIAPALCTSIDGTQPDPLLTNPSGNCAAQFNVNNESTVVIQGNTSNTGTNFFNIFSPINMYLSSTQCLNYTIEGSTCPGSSIAVQNATLTSDTVCGCNPGDVLDDDACVPCAEGTSSPNYLTPCTDCSPNTFTSSTGSSQCTTCPSGSYTLDEGATECPSEAIPITYDCNAAPSSASEVIIAPWNGTFYTASVANCTSCWATTDDVSIPNLYTNITASNSTTILIMDQTTVYCTSTGTAGVRWLFTNSSNEDILDTCVPNITAIGNELDGGWVVNINSCANLCRTTSGCITYEYSSAAPNCKLFDAITEIGTDSTACVGAVFATESPTLDIAYSSTVRSFNLTDLSDFTSILDPDGANTSMTLTFNSPIVYFTITNETGVVRNFSSLETAVQSGMLFDVINIAAIIHNTTILSRTIELTYAYLHNVTFEYGVESTTDNISLSTILDTPFASVTEIATPYLNVSTIRALKNSPILYRAVTSMDDLENEDIPLTVVENEEFSIYFDSTERLYVGTFLNASQPFGNYFIIEPQVAQAYYVYGGECDGATVRVVIASNGSYYVSITASDSYAVYRSAPELLPLGGYVFPNPSGDFLMNATGSTINMGTIEELTSISQIWVPDALWIDGAECDSYTQEFPPGLPDPWIQDYAFTKNCSFINNVTTSFDVFGNVQIHVSVTTISKNFSVEFPGMTCEGATLGVINFTANEYDLETNISCTTDATPPLSQINVIYEDETCEIVPEITPCIFSGIDLSEYAQIYTLPPITFSGYTWTYRFGLCTPFICDGTANSIACVTQTNPDSSTTEINLGVWYEQSSTYSDEILYTLYTGGSSGAFEVCGGGFSFGARITCDENATFEFLDFTFPDVCTIVGSFISSAVCDVTTSTTTTTSSTWSTSSSTSAADDEPTSTRKRVGPAKHTRTTPAPETIQKTYITITEENNIVTYQAVIVVLLGATLLTGIVFQFYIRPRWTKASGYLP